MFQAYVIACAASFSFEIYNDICFRSDDTLGPYETSEECSKRAIEMVDITIDGPGTKFTFLMLGNPEQIYAEGFCEPINTDPAV